MLAAATTGSVLREQCDACGGFWLERAALEALMGRKLPSLGVTQPSARTCPNTGDPLARAQLEGALIERCTRCGGVFVETAEHERLKERAEGRDAATAGSFLEALGVALMWSNFLD